MTKYLKLFSAHTEYEDWKYNSDEYVTPNVSMCEQENELHYNTTPTKVRLYNGDTLVAESNDLYFHATCNGGDGVPGYNESSLDGGCGYPINLYTLNYSQPYDSFEFDINGATNVTVTAGSEQFTYSMNGKTLKVTSTEGTWQYLHSFGVNYTCQGLQCESEIVIDYDA